MTKNLITKISNQASAWGRVLLVCFVSQLVFSSAAAAGLFNCVTMPLDAAAQPLDETAMEMPSCHGVSDAATETLKPVKTESDCCDENCTMMGCKMISALLLHADLSAEHEPQALTDLGVLQPPQTTSKYFFRPPISA